MSSESSKPGVPEQPMQCEEKGGVFLGLIDTIGYNPLVRLWKEPRSKQFRSLNYRSLLSLTFSLTAVIATLVVILPPGQTQLRERFSTSTGSLGVSTELIGVSDSQATVGPEEKSHAPRPQPHKQAEELPRSLTSPSLPIRIGKDVQFVLFDYYYGQLNNQIAALVASMVSMQMHSPTATLVLPPIKLGTESTRQLSDDQTDELSSFENLFDLQELRKAANVIPYQEFLETDVARISLQSKVCVFNDPTMRSPLTSSSVFRDIYGFSRVRELDADFKDIWNGNNCVRFADEYKEKALECGENPAVLLLPKMFGGMAWRCVDLYPNFRDNFVRVVPRPEFRRTVQDWSQTLPGPVLGLHVRLLSPEDRECFAQTEDGPAGFVRALTAKYPEAFAKARTIFVAYDPTDADLFQVYTSLAKHFAHSGKLVTSCGDLENCGSHRSAWARELSEEGFGRVFRQPYAFSVLDMWALASADDFIGTSRSTFSANVHRWRSFQTPLLHNTRKQGQDPSILKNFAVCEDSERSATTAMGA